MTEESHAAAVNRIKMDFANQIDAQFAKIRVARDLARSATETINGFVTECNARLSRFATADFTPAKLDESTLAAIGQQHGLSIDESRVIVA